MTFKKNFVCAVKVNGKILRESNDRVELPFGSEYSLLLKNLDSVRMQARISIDGKDATGWLIIGPNQSIDVERFVEQLDRGNRFKFIERTERIEEHRGIKAEDGLVRVEFKREKVYEPSQVTYTYYYHYPWLNYNFCGTLGQASNTLHDGHTVTVTNTSGSLHPRRAMAAMSTARSAEPINYQAQNVAQVSQNEAGITVPGSISDQKFIAVSSFETERPEVVILHLVGKKTGVPVKVAKTVQTKLECETCGKKNKSSAKFCIECGTSLEKV